MFGFSGPALSPRKGEGMDSFWQDVRYAVRTLRRQPGFAAVAVLVLAAVTGLNTSLFTFANALTLHPPTGITDPSRVVSLYPVVSFGEPELFSVAEYRFLAGHAKSINAAAVTGAGTVQLGPKSANGTTGALLVSGNFFDTLGIKTTMGRSFLANEDRTDAPQPVTVLGAGLWQGRFGSDPRLWVERCSSTTSRSRLSASRLATSSDWSRRLKAGLACSCQWPRSGCCTRNFRHTWVLRTSSADLRLVRLVSRLGPKPMFSSDSPTGKPVPSLEASSSPGLRFCPIPAEA
jgi:hypothetical protein